MKNIKKSITWLCCITALIVTSLMFSADIFAAGASVTASSSTIYVGQSVTFTVSAQNGAGYLTVSGATQDYSWFDNSSKSYTVTATSVGQLQVTVNGVLGDYDTELDTPVSGSATVNVIAKPVTPSNPGNNGNTSGGNTGNTTPTDPDEKDEAKDSVSSLASLSVDKGALSPKFDKGITSYEVNLPAGTTSLKVDAKATSAKANISGTGEVNVKPGDNPIEITCTAEDGSKTVYTIKAIVSEKPVAYVTYGNKKLGVLNEATTVSGLFTETKIKVDGKEVIAWENKSLKITLLYMQDEKTGLKSLYMYDINKGVATSIYKPFSFHGKNLAMVDIPKKLQEREGMKLSSINLDGVDVSAWVFHDKTFANYALLYVMDEAGNMVYYQYEKKENSLQLFSQAAAVTQDSYQKYVKKMENQNKAYLIAVIALSIFSIMLLISTIVLFVKRKNTSKFKKIKIDKPQLSAEAKSLLNKQD